MTRLSISRVTAPKMSSVNSGLWTGSSTAALYLKESVELYTRMHFSVFANRYTQMVDFAFARLSAKVASQCSFVAEEGFGKESPLFNDYDMLGICLFY